MKTIDGSSLPNAAHVAHDLKTWPEPFNATAEGRKPYEIRSSRDRKFEVGDILILREWKPRANLSPVYKEVIQRAQWEASHSSGEYTGAVVIRQISYITRGGEWGLPPDLCVLGLGMVE